MYVTIYAAFGLKSKLQIWNEKFWGEIHLHVCMYIEVITQLFRPVYLSWIIFIVDINDPIEMSHGRLWFEIKTIFINFWGEDLFLNFKNKIFTNIMFNIIKVSIEILFVLSNTIYSTFHVIFHVA